MDERVFHETLKKIRWSTNRDDLTVATNTALQLLLRRPTDQQLLSSLLAQVAKVTGSLSSAKSGAQSAAVRQAAVRCVVLLQSAKHGRLNRSQNIELQQQRRARR